MTSEIFVISALSAQLALFATPSIFGFAAVVVVCVAVATICFGVFPQAEPFSVLKVR